jgi:hypothetical protein
MSETPSYWNIKVYGDNGRERETLRGLNYARTDTLMTIFEREGVQAQAIPYEEDGTHISGKGFSVNWERDSHRTVDSSE